MEDTDEDVRLVIYRKLAETGRAPRPDEVAASVGRPLDDIHRSIDRLT